ncbi:hypothetical protein ACVXZ4_13845 [Lacisediminihabitans sp. FW035]
MRTPKPPAPVDPHLLTGVAGLAVSGLILLEVGVRVTLGVRPALDDSAALADFASRTSGQTIAITLIDTLMMAGLIVFLAGFRELITLAEGQLEWLTSIVLGAGFVFVGVTLVGDSLEAGGAFGAIGTAPDPTTIRVLTEGYLLLFGPVSYALVALIAATSAYVIFASTAFPRWTGRLAVVVAALNVVALLTAFGGTDNRSFASVGGWGGAVFATFPWLVWVAATSILALRQRRVR